MHEYREATVYSRRQVRPGRTCFICSVFPGDVMTVVFVTRNESRKTA